MGITGKICDKFYRHWLAAQSLDVLKLRLAAKKGVLGLCYHALADGLEDYPYRTSPHAFDAQLSFLKEIFDIVSVSEAVEMLKKGIVADRDRPVAMICFDDGYRCNLTLATPVLERHNIPATLFAARDLVRKPGPTYLSEAELVALAEHPLWEVGGHGTTHNVLIGFLPEDQVYESVQSSIWLSDLLGKGQRGFAYPQGQFNSVVVSNIRPHFAYGLATDRRIASVPDLYQIRRFCPTCAHDGIHEFAQAIACVPLEGG